MKDEEGNSERNEEKDLCLKGHAKGGTERKRDAAKDEESDKDNNGNKEDPGKNFDSAIERKQIAAKGEEDCNGNKEGPGKNFDSAIERKKKAAKGEESDEERNAQHAETNTVTRKKKATEELIEEIPDFSLPTSILRFLNQDDSSVWESDHEYFQGLLAVEKARGLSYFLRQQLRRSFFTVKESSSFASTTATSNRKALRLSALMDELLQDLEAKLFRKLVAMERQPLAEKLLDALEASDVQRKVFRHVFVRASGMASSSHDTEDARNLYYTLEKEGRSPPNSIPVAHLQELFDVSLAEIMKWTDAQSVWVKEQLYRSTASPNAQISAMDRNTLSALMGLELKPAQYQALGSSMLQNILLEDEAFKQTATGKILQQRKTMESMQADVEEDSPPIPSALSEALTKSMPSSKSIKKDRLYDVLSHIAVAEQQSKKQSLDAMDGKKSDNGSSDPFAERVKNEPQENETDWAVLQPQDSKDSSPEDSDDIQKQANDQFGPYKSDLSYLEDQVLLAEREAKLIQLKSLLDNAGDEEDDDMPFGDIDEYYQCFSPPHRRREDTNLKFKQIKSAEKAEQRLKQLKEKIRTKLTASRRENGKEFRLEQLCQALDLSKFEKYCILALAKSVIMPDKGGRRQHSMLGTRSAEVGSLIDSFCSTLEEKMTSRRYFYKSATLIREGILTLSQDDFMTDLSMCRVELDRRLFDYIVGLDTEMSELVNGSHLYMPDVDLDDVVMPPETKKRIYEAVLCFEDVKETFHRLEIDQKFTYGRGQNLLFYGASGTGKTMLANAVATKLKKKVLLVNFPTLGQNQSGSLIKFLFREARINRALLFFDECESLFLDRKKGGTSVNMILTELERFDGLCILATNRAYDLDEAMHRRISLAIEFRKPDHIMREQIWKTLQPPKLPLDDDINIGVLAKKYELTGGLVKNAWLQAVSLMVQRGGDKITQADLMQAASEQVVGNLSLEDFDRRVIPTTGIDSMVLSKTIKESLNSIVQYSKAQSVLFGQWGFDKLHRSTTGISVLFTGPPGTGKSMASEAIGFELGRPLLVVNVAELVSKWVGETGKNIEAVFSDAKKRDAVLVFDEAEGLFASRSVEGSSSVSRHDTMNVGLLLQYIEHFKGVCVVITNMKRVIDEAFFRRFRFVLDFEIPDVSSRELIWKSIVPKDCPLAADVSFRELANRYEMCGGDIKNALLCAATNAALRSDSDRRMVTMHDLSTACTAEMQKQGDRAKSLAMYS